MDPLTQLDVLVPTFQKLSSTTTVDQLDRPTPCEAWKLRDLYGHLTGGATMFAALIRGAEPPAPVGVDDAAIPSTTNTAIADLDAAFRGPGALDRTLATPFGEMPGETFARLIAFDLLMHTWDLARTTGQDVDLPDDVVAAIDAFARQAITPDLRGPQTFGPEMTAPEGASALDCLAAFSGRRL